MSEDIFWDGMNIGDRIGGLIAIDDAIRKWSDVADAEFRTLVDHGNQEHLFDKYGYDVVADKASLIGTVDRAMKAALAVSINSHTEAYLKEECHWLQIGLSRGAGVPRMWELLETQLGFNKADVPGYTSAEKARMWGNKFKHNSGLKDAEFVKHFGGTVGEEIEYEKEDWRSVIEDVRSLLTELARLREAQHPRWT